jgi:hypothetical protein
MAVTSSSLFADYLDLEPTRISISLPLLCLKKFRLGYVSKIDFGGFTISLWVCIGIDISFFLPLVSLSRSLLLKAGVTYFDLDLL